MSTNVFGGNKSSEKVVSVKEILPRAQYLNSLWEEIFHRPFAERANVSKKIAMLISVRNSLTFLPTSLI